MQLSPTQVFAQFAIRISSGSRTRRRSLNAVLPAAADLVLEPRLVLDGGGSGMDNMPPTLTVEVAPIPDTAVNGDVVGYATATDVDGDTITFSFEGGSQTDPTGTFTIDGNTGVITIANADNIGSQDETEDSPAGWSFTATIVASDGPASPGDTSATVDLAVMKSPFQIISPTEGETFIATTDDIIFEATRTKGVRVQVEILMKEADGIYRPITNPNFTAKAEIGGRGTTAVHNFHKGVPGDYLIEYKFKQGNGWTDTGEKVRFTVVPTN